MAITRIGSATGTNSCTLPSHQAGDLILIFAYRDGSATAPSLPAGYWNVTNNGANTNSMRVGYMIADSSSETSGTWTNATSLIAVVYRGARVGSFSVGGAASTTVNYPARTLLKSDNTSWVVGAAGHRSVDTNVQNAPSGMTNVNSVLDATDELAVHDTNGTVTSWSSTNVSVGGTSSGWRSAVVELIDAGSLILGYDVIGGSTNTFTDWFVGASFDNIRNGSVSKLSWYGNSNSGSITMDCAIYEETSLNNYTFIAQAQSTISVGSTPAWNDFDLRANLQVGKRYYIAVWSTGAFTFYFNSGAQAGTTYATTGNTFNTWPSPELGGATDAAPLSMYVTFTRIQGTSDGTSTVTGTIFDAGGGNSLMAGTSDGVASVTGTILAKGSLHGTSDGIASTSGNLIGRINAAGQSSGTSTVTGSMSAKAYLVGASAGLSSVTGLIVADGILTGTSNGVASVSGSLNAKGGIVGLSNGTSTATAQIFAKGQLIGSTQGTSTAVASSNNRIIGTAEGVASVSGILTGKGYVVASSFGSSSVSGSVTGKAYIVSSSHGTSTVQGLINAKGILIGTSDGTSNVTGSMGGGFRRKIIVIS